MKITTDVAESLFACVKANALEAMSQALEELIPMLEDVDKPDIDGATITVKTSVGRAAADWTISATATCKRDVVAIKSEPVEAKINPNQPELFETPRGEDRDGGKIHKSQGIEAKER